MISLARLTALAAAVSAVSAVVPLVMTGRVAEHAPDRPATIARAAAAPILFEPLRLASIRPAPGTRPLPLSQSAKPSTVEQPAPPAIEPPPAPPDGPARVELPVPSDFRVPYVPDLPEADEAGVLVCDLTGLPPVAAATALQDCVDRSTPYSSVEIPAGVHVLGDQVVVSKPLTIRTAGSAVYAMNCVKDPSTCATLMAGRDLYDRFGMLRVVSTAHVHLEHLVMDGDRAGRLDSAAARACQRGSNAYGFNAAVLACADCLVEDLLSRNALCGTALVWTGERATIRNSTFSANGDASALRMWADGLTMVYAPDAVVQGNRFVDNSDIGIIIGHGPRARVEDNVVIQRAQPVFAGLMLDNFNSNDLRVAGDFRGAVVARNTVDCGEQLCVFGIQAGPHPWYQSDNIAGGEVRDNVVRGAKVGINLDGAGRRLAPIAVFGNRVSDVPVGTKFSSCGRDLSSAWMNVAPSSYVDRRKEFTETAEAASDSCQFFSPLAPLDEGGGGP